MASRKKTLASRGKRYTAEEKKKILAHVEKINKEKGRGGQVSAARKFKVAPLTIKGWMKEAPAGNSPPRTKSPRNPEKALARMAEIAARISQRESEINSLWREFDALKAKL